jgi:hypothetical protein
MMLHSSSRVGVVAEGLMIVVAPLFPVVVVSARLVDSVF